LKETLGSLCETSPGMKVGREPFASARAGQLRRMRSSLHRRKKNEFRERLTTRRGLSVRLLQESCSKIRALSSEKEADYSK
jgi:hypothetical protein